MPSIENQTLSKLYYSIGEVAEMLQVNASLLRFWEKEFNLVVSKKNKKGNRLFSVKEIEQIKRIYHFVKVYVPFVAATNVLLNNMMLKIRT